MNLGYMWKAIVAALGAAVTSVTVLETSQAMTWQSLAIALFGAIGTGLATFAKGNTEKIKAGGKDVPVSQQIPGYEQVNPEQFQPDLHPSEAVVPDLGLPTAYPR